MNSNEMDNATTADGNSSDTTDLRLKDGVKILADKKSNDNIAGNGRIKV